MRASSIIALSLIGGLATAPARAAELTVETLTPPRSAYTFAQTPDGFLWIGTLGDVLRFDGVALRSFREGSDLSTTRPWALRLAAATDGALWTAFGGGVARFDRDGRLHADIRGEGGLQVRRGSLWKRLGPETGLRDPFVWSLLPRPAGGMWVGTERGIARFEDDQVVQWLDPTSGLTDPFTLALAETADGTLWAGTSTRLFRVTDGRAVGTDLAAPITALASEDRTLWVGTPRGLARVVAGRPTKWFRTTDGLPSDDVTALAGDRRGGVWVGTAQGLAHVTGDDGARPEPVAVRLADQNVIALLVDRTNQVWVGTRTGGVAKIADRRVWTFGADGGLDGQARVAWSGRDGSIWFGTDRGLLQVVRTGRALAAHPGAWRPHTEAEQPRGLARDDGGGVWLATAAGLISLAEDPVVGWRRRRVEGVPAAGCTALAWAGDSLWVAWATGGASRFRVHSQESDAIRIEEEGRWAAGSGFCDGAAVALVEGPSGIVWAAVPGAGVGSVGADGRAVCLGSDRGLAVESVQSLAVDGRGRLWVGMLQDQGLAVLLDGQFRTFLSRDGLFCDSIYEVVSAGGGGLWLSCGSGATWVNADALAAASGRRSRSVSGIAVSVLEGIAPGPPVVDSHPSAVVGPDGSLWLASRAAVSRISPGVYRAPPLARAQVDAVRVNGQDLPLPPSAPRNLSFEVTATQATWEIDFAAPTLAFPSAQAFAHQLDARAMTTIYEGPRRARFEDLGSGLYQVELLSGDGVGGWQPEPTHITIRVRAPLWRRWDLWGAVVLAAGAALTLAHRLRVARMARRYQVVHQERNRIARDLHDSVGQVFASVGMHLDAASRLVRGRNAHAEQVLTRARAVARDGREQMRRAIWELRSEGLEAPSLSDALTAIVARQRRHGGPEVALKVEHVPAGTAEFEFEVLRIAEEAISNAIEHGNARRVDVQWTCSKESAELSVTDDGVGIPVDPSSLAASGHFGLVGIVERATRMEAEVLVTRPEDGGTRLRLVIPMDRWSRRVGREPNA